MVLFADDTLLYVTKNTNNAAENMLQTHIKLIEPWFVEWKLNINVTSAIMFSNKQTHNTKNLMLKNIKLQWTNSIKYLGVHIDNNFTFNKHVNYVTTHAKVAKNCLFPLINSHSSLPLKIRLNIYKTYIRLIFTYATPTWESIGSP